MAKAIQCTIVTPASAILDAEITYASMPAWDGQIGIMSGGSPILVKLGSGSLRLDFPEGGSRWYLLDGGFAEFQNDHLSLLSDDAVPAERISIREAEAELAEANARVTQPGQDQQTVQRAQQRSFAKMQLAREHASRGGAI